MPRDDVARQQKAILESRTIELQPRRANDRRGNQVVTEDRHQPRPAGKYALLGKRRRSAAYYLFARFVQSSFRSTLEGPLDTDGVSLSAGNVAWLTVDRCDEYQIPHRKHSSKKDFVSVLAGDIRFRPKLKGLQRRMRAMIEAHDAGYQISKVPIRLVNGGLGTEKSGAQMSLFSFAKIECRRLEPALTTRLKRTD